MCVFGVLKKREYTMRVCIFRVRSTLLAGISIVYLNLGKLRVEYTLWVGIVFEIIYDKKNVILELRWLENKNKRRILNREYVFAI